MKLTVVIRDDTPFIHLGDSPAYRTVVVQMPGVEAELRMKKEESISRCILEDDDEPK